MDSIESLRNLASARRSKLFALLGEDIGAVISCDLPTKNYLSGYYSMNDTYSSYLSAAVATRDRTALVVSAADAGPALECLGDPTLIFRYGLFYFERSADGPLVEYDTPGFKTFAEAVMAAVNAVAPKELKLGVDGRGGADLKTVLGAARPTVDISDEIVRSRATKLPAELVRLRRATQLVEAGVDTIRREFKVGMSEWELAGLVASEMVRGGGVPEFISVTTGPRSALADAYPTTRKIQSGDIIRLDAGCVVDGYKSDMARSFVVGEASKLITARYKAISEGLEAELAAVRSGAKVRDVHLAAVNTTRSAGIPSYRRHHCGHGIGLSGYEYPLINESSEAVLADGMCLCVETPFYELGWGGMMIEDTIRVTEDGFDPITTIPRQLFQLA